MNKLGGEGEGGEVEGEGAGGGGGEGRATDEGKKDEWETSQFFLIEKTTLFRQRYDRMG